jgi:hypothetical protein
MNQITVERRDQYGTPVFHPVCENARTFARIAKTKTLTLDTLKQVSLLGYAIKIERTPETLEFKTA